jgi:hypothetical protein
MCRPDERCVMDGATPTCMTALIGDPACECACDQACVDDGGPTCHVELPTYLEDPCAATGGCGPGQSCVSDDLGGTECRNQLTGPPNPCGGCAEYDVCVNVDGTPTCRLETKPPLVAGLAEGVGLFTSLVLHDGVPTFVYYDRLRENLRGAVALFSYDEAFGTFAIGKVACDPRNDLGQHASLAVNPVDGSLSVAFQGSGGETLLHYRTTGADLFIGNVESVDEGLRDTRIHLVGAYAHMVFDPNGLPYIAYADQTENDMVLAFRPVDEWMWITGVPTGVANATPVSLLTDGAYGSFARVALDDDQAYISTYLRARNDFDKDVSRLVLHLIDLPEP